MQNTQSEKVVTNDAESKEETTWYERGINAVENMFSTSTNEEVTILEKMELLSDDMLLVQTNQENRIKALTEKVKKLEETISEISADIYEEDKVEFVICSGESALAEVLVH